MARAKYGPASRRRRRRVLKRAKGQYGGRRRLYRTARESVARAMAYSYRDRKAKKRMFRALWITRIHAACEEFAISYSRLISGLKKAKSAVSRKMLAELAVSDKTTFGRLVDTAKKALDTKK